MLSSIVLTLGQILSFLGVLKRFGMSVSPAIRDKRGRTSGSARVGVQKPRHEQGRRMSEQGMAGRPRFVLAAAGHAPVDSAPERGESVEFLLEHEQTTIGSAPDQDIVLGDLAPEHAVIDWVENGDEFVFRSLTGDATATIDGKPIINGRHHGDRLDVGPHVLVFQRDEAANHVRVEGARQGGEYAGGGRHQPGGHEAELS
jgi:hypothetical protein